MANNILKIFPQDSLLLNCTEPRDKEKEMLCKKYGIKLITIPYWWDNKIDSLKSVVCNIQNS